jgi:chromosome partitioning protein
MLITVASFKGGVGKTTTAMHLAAFLQTQAPTVLFDSDRTRNALAWASRGNLPFHVAPFGQALKLGPQYVHKVIDTGQRPEDMDFKEQAEQSDLLVIPAEPGALENDSLMLSLQALIEMGVTNFRVLIVQDPPPPEPEGIELRAQLEAEGVPMFETAIPRVKAFRHAAKAGVTVDAYTSDPRAKRGWMAYQAVGREVLTHG